jgi:hypothetical protein
MESIALVSPDLDQLSRKARSDTHGRTRILVMTLSPAPGELLKLGVSGRQMHHQADQLIAA